MKKYVILALFTASLFAGDYPLKISPSQEKINPLVIEKLNLSENGETKVWIFFTDKEIFSQAALKISLTVLENQFTPKSIDRRRKRTDNPELFTFSDIPVSENYIEQLELAGIKIDRRSRWLNAVSATVSSSDLNVLEDFEFVAEIKPVAVFKRNPLPEKSIDIPEVQRIIEDFPDTLKSRYGKSYNQLNLENIPIMHQLGITGENIIIAIFDGGFNLNHSVYNNLNSIKDTFFIDSAEVDFSHGTSTLSLIGGYMPDSLIGVAYNAGFITAATEIASTEIVAEEDNWVAAAEWVDLMGADIISSSLGYYDWYQYSDLDGQTATITIAAEEATSKGIVVVSSAGNEARTSWHYITPPSDGENVIAVGATDSMGQIAGFSSRGPTYDERIKPDVVAMGVSAHTASSSGGFRSANGTSFSAPITSGTVALMLEVNPDWTPLQVKEALIKSADKYNNPDTVYGYGLFDAFVASEIYKFDTIYSPIIMSYGDSISLEISVSSPVDSILTNTNITVMGLPDSAEFTSVDNTTGILNFSPSETDIGKHYQIYMTAQSGALLAINMEIEITVMSETKVTVGPNPFDDSLTIFLGSELAMNNAVLEEISIYNLNGEKVWESLSDINNMNMSSVVWQGINSSGTKIASGVYLVYVRTNLSEHRLKVFKK